MPNPPLDTHLLDRAIRFAVRAHAGTQRRGKGFPYIVHPLEALQIVSTITSDQEIMAAAVLHDVLEDTPVTRQALRRAFGPRVAAWVEAESDCLPPGENLAESATWRQRKEASLKRLAEASREAKIVAMGDKLSNIRAIARDYDTIGDACWSLFHVSDKAQHAWRYHSLVEALRTLSDTAAFREFEALVNHVFPLPTASKK